jgi:hypothetical protein
VNSDPELISFFLLFLDTVGISRSDLTFRLHIHETAEIESAERFWLSLTGARPEQFRKTSLKQQNPMTTRKNTGDDYRGCLRVEVRRSCELYRKIEGWASAVAASAEACVSITWTDRAPGEGFEPPLSGPKPLVLPLDDPGLPSPHLTRNATATLGRRVTPTTWDLGCRYSPDPPPIRGPSDQTGWPGADDGET